MMCLDDTLIQSPIPFTIDLRDMVRRHIVRRALAYMEQSQKRRNRALADSNIEEYKREIRQSVKQFYGTLPIGKDAEPINPRIVSIFEKDGYRIENVLFESFPGWQVNATIYVPTDFNPPFPAVVIPVGHSGKQFKSYQLPAQFFARCGYLAVLFDPPGQAGEKQIGNDHFIDGVRCYLVGHTSSRYFIADAIRCIDYLETRDDVDLAGGVAMTGVSGGGTTTILAALLDERISVTGPSCCLTSLVDLDITQCYCGCPETHMWRRYAERIDEIDLLCAFAPKPTLLMAGEFDEVFKIDDTRKLAKQVRQFYETTNASEQFEFFVDKAGHCYSLTQAREFAKFMNRWLINQPERKISDLPDEKFALDPYEQLRCYPNTATNMKNITLETASKLELSRKNDTGKIREAIRNIIGVDEKSVNLPEVKISKPFRVWTHNWQQLILTSDEDIELPATFLSADQTPAPTIFHIDEIHRNRLLQAGGLLTKVIGFTDRDTQHYNLFTIDLRGWGDTKPALYPYEMASWGSIDRYLAYSSAALGDSIMAMRIRDALSAIKFLQTQQQVDKNKIIVTASGIAGIIALHLAYLAEISSVIIWDTLVSFNSLLEADNYSFPADIFIPNVLLSYDLPAIASFSKPNVSIINPLRGDGQKIAESNIINLNKTLGKSIYLNISNNLLADTISTLAKQYACKP